MLCRCINLSKASGQKARRTSATRGNREKGGWSCVAGNMFAFRVRHSFPCVLPRNWSSQPVSGSMLPLRRSCLPSSFSAWPVSSGSPPRRVRSFRDWALCGDPDLVAQLAVASQAAPGQDVLQLGRPNVDILERVPRREPVANCICGSVRQMPILPSLLRVPGPHRTLGTRIYAF